MNFVITGGAGFIGSNLVHFLRQHHPNLEITVFDDFSTGSRQNLESCDVRIIEGSVLDAALLHKTFSGADSIIHLAARPSVPKSIESPRPTHDTNATGTLNVLEAARENSSHVIVASSSSVYGANPTLPKKESLAPQPLSPYAASKLAAESYALAWGKSYELPTLAFRFFNVYGPGQMPGHAYAAVVPSFLSAHLRGDPLLVHGDGEQSRDFTFVTTVCEILYTAARNQLGHETPVNLALGSRTSLNELIKVMEKTVGSRVAVEYGPPRVGDVRHSSADPSLLRSLFPSVSAIPLQQGLSKTYEWLTQIS